MPATAMTEALSPMLTGSKIAATAAESEREMSECFMVNWVMPLKPNSTQKVTAILSLWRSATS